MIESGATPLGIHMEAPAQRAQTKAQGVFKAKVKLDELIIFSHQMTSLMKAGISIVRAMRGLAESSRNPYFAVVLEDVASDLEAGTDLATCLKRHGDVFSTLYASVIHVGENTGRLDEAFRRIARYLELERETIKRLKSATRYPLFVMIAIGIAIAILNLFVIPAFAGVFAKFGADLPWQTQVILGISNFFVAYWHVVLGVIVAASYAVARWVATPEGKHSWDRGKLKLPILGSIFERINLARFCQTFAMVMQSGLPVTQGLGVVAGAIGNDYMARKVLAMRSGIERGESITSTAAASGMFSGVVMQMIAVGEETGSIDELLVQAGGFYEEEVDYLLKGLTDAVEPILIIAIGAMVLVLALGVFLPLWDLSAVATR
ncbi:MAG: type II secretion system F family protein [Gammaproteobacteria bacterium]|nr:type II secretion system F family protein [Gammaproteobacteria bacterium]